MYPAHHELDSKVNSILTIHEIMDKFCQGHYLMNAGSLIAALLAE